MSFQPDERLNAHNAGKSTWTKAFRPWVRIHPEEYEEKSRAMQREKYLKSGWGRIASHNHKKTVMYRSMTVWLGGGETGSAT